MKNLVDAIMKHLINLMMKLSIWLTTGVAVKKLTGKNCLQVQLVRLGQDVIQFKKCWSCRISGN